MPANFLGKPEAVCLEVSAVVKRGNCPMASFWVASFFVFFVSFAGFASDGAAQEPLTQESPTQEAAVQESAAQEPAAQESVSQEVLALDYLLRLARTPADDAEAREKLYLGLIEKCPETEAAEEAHWALSNLYLDDFDEPKEDKAREILEKFLERYPASRWRQHVESRLAWLWG